METPPPEPTPIPARRRPLTLLILGAALALAAGVWGAFHLSASHRGARTAPPASQGGLVIDTTAAENGRIDPALPLRCFVRGQFVGDLALADCARRNGVATDALDVGLDQAGVMAATDPFGIDPASPPAPSGDAGALAAQTPPVIDPAEAGLPDASLQACLRHSAGRWRRTPADMDLNTCVQLLFNGRCERPDGAAYGRWGQQTLRLVPGRVEISDDNKTFQTLVAQGANCSIPPVP